MEPVKRNLYEDRLKPVNFQQPQQKNIPPHNSKTQQSKRKQNIIHK